jgi:hypothetical protein
MTARPVMNHYAKKVAAIGFLVFLGLWTVGAIRGMMLDYPPPPSLPLVSIASGSSERAYDNAAAANNLKQIGMIETPVPLLLDNPDVDKISIHEKRAILTSGTASYDTDEPLIRTAIQEEQASIFNEKKTGIQPNRKLTMEIGVHPDKFDALVEKLKKIGILASSNIEKKDRTDEFRKLNVRRKSLKGHLADVMKLRSSAKASLDDSLKLEQKIQDIDKELQALSVQFGDLLGKESYYFVNVTLTEYQPGDRHDKTYTTPQRIFHAFAWAIVWWFAVALAFGLVAATGVSIWMLRQKPPGS